MASSPLLVAEAAAANVAVSSVAMTPLLAMSSSSSVRDANCRGSDIFFSGVESEREASENE